MCSAKTVEVERNENVRTTRTSLRYSTRRSKAVGKNGPVKLFLARRFICQRCMHFLALAFLGRWLWDSGTPLRSWDPDKLSLLSPSPQPWKENSTQTIIVSSNLANRCVNFFLITKRTSSKCMWAKNIPRTDLVGLPENVNRRSFPPIKIFRPQCFTRRSKALLIQPLEQSTSVLIQCSSFQRLNFGLASDWLRPTPPPTLQVGRQFLFLSLRSSPLLELRNLWWQ